MYGLGRLPSIDDRDVKFPMRAALAPVPEPVTRYWYFRNVLDQGNTPQCVGHAWRGWLQSAPVIYKLADPDAHKIYFEAQKVDEWPGEGYEGTSVRAGAEYLNTMGHVAQYLWAFDAETVIKYLLTTGPVVMGTSWYNSMFDPDSKGNLKVDPASGFAGGHAWLLYGANRKTKKVRMVNSWGTGWGQKGKAWLSFDALGTLLSEYDSEACTASEKVVV
jgi:hypothetical protein